MPTTKAFEAAPPFLDNVPVYELLRFALSEVIANGP